MATRYFCDQCQQEIRGREWFRAGVWHPNGTIRTIDVYIEDDNDSDPDETKQFCSAHCRMVWLAAECGTPELAAQAIDIDTVATLLSDLITDLNRHAGNNFTSVTEGYRWLQTNGRSQETKKLEGSYCPNLQETIGSVAEKMCEWSLREKLLWRVTFNGVELISRPGDRPESIVEQYRKAMDPEDLPGNVASAPGGFASARERFFFVQPVTETPVFFLEKSHCERNARKLIGTENAHGGQVAGIPIYKAVCVGSVFEKGADNAK